MKLNKEQVADLLVNALVNAAYARMCGNIDQVATAYTKLAENCKDALVEPFVAMEFTKVKEWANIDASLAGIAIYNKDYAFAQQLAEQARTWIDNI